MWTLWVAAAMAQGQPRIIEGTPEFGDCLQQAGCADRFYRFLGLSMAEQGFTFQNDPQLLSPTLSRRDGWTVGGLLTTFPFQPPRENLSGKEEQTSYSPVLPRVFGGYKVSKKSSGVEGSAPIEVRSYEGITCVRNVDGTHAFDLTTGKKLFTCKQGERPIVRQGKYLLTSNLDRRVTLRDATKDYAVVGTMNLGMFDLIPSNKSNGELFACTADGSIVVAIPK